MLSRVRVVADPAGCLFPGGGLPVGADFDIPRGSRCSAEHEFTPSTGTCSYYGCGDGCSSSRVLGCQWISCPLSRDTGVPRNSGGDYWGVTEVVSSVSIKSVRIVLGVLFYPEVESQVLPLRVDPAWISLLSWARASCRLPARTAVMVQMVAGLSAYVHLSIDAGLACSFCMLYVQCFTEGPQPWGVRLDVGKDCALALRGWRRG